MQASPTREPENEECHAHSTCARDGLNGDGAAAVHCSRRQRGRECFGADAASCGPDASAFSDKPAAACGDRTNRPHAGVARALAPGARIEDRLILEGVERAERRRAAWAERAAHELDGATFRPSIDPLSCELARAQRERMETSEDGAAWARARAEELLVRWRRRGGRRGGAVEGWGAGAGG
eukprot:scaffold4987_cov91-Isochrysis_galbana.AAC.3